MCIGAPDIKEPIEYQTSQSPDYKTPESVMTGRRGTILAGTGTGTPNMNRRRRGTVLSGASGGGMGPTSVPAKRTVLGG